MRTLTFAAALLALSTAFLLYAVNYDARRLEAELQRREREGERLRGDIAILKAERAHLGRPARIQPLARAQGLLPLSPRQIAGADDVVPQSVSAASASR
jgi:cell division protein FtsL